jgi:protein SCO1
MNRAAVGLAALLALASTAAAGKAPDISPPPGARLPLDLVFQDEVGKSATIAQALNGHPAVVVFADWTCNALCGTTLGQAAMVLRETHLVPGRDYVFLAIGMDARNSPRDAATMKAVHLSDAPLLSAASHFLTGDVAATHKAMANVGFHAIYLPDQDQFAHPAALLVVSANGLLERVMPSFMLEPSELRAALAKPPEAADFGHRLLLICHAVLTGSYGRWVPNALMICGVGTLLVMAGTLTVLFRRGPTTR